MGAFSALGPAPRWWREPIPWYPDVAFGPYRKMELHGGYSRRELAFDGAIHALGVFLGMDKASKYSDARPRVPRGGGYIFFFPTGVLRPPRFAPSLLESSAQLCSSSTRHRNVHSHFVTSHTAGGYTLDLAHGVLHTSHPRLVESSAQACNTSPLPRHLPHVTPSSNAS